MTASSDPAPTVRTADSFVNGDDRIAWSARVNQIGTDATGIVEAVLELKMKLKVVDYTLIH
ncbi:hypothetical protein ACWEH1_30465 [Micromonospora chersina]